MRRDCKEKEELIQRVLESSARALLPDLELDEMVIVDDEDSAEASPPLLLSASALSSSSTMTTSSSSMSGSSARALLSSTRWISSSFSLQSLRIVPTDGQ